MFMLLLNKSLSFKTTGENIIVQAETGVILKSSFQGGPEMLLQKTSGLTSSCVELNTLRYVYATTTGKAIEKILRKQLQN